MAKKSVKKPATKPAKKPGRMDWLWLSLIAAGTGWVGYAVATAAPTPPPADKPPADRPPPPADTISPAVPPTDQQRPSPAELAKMNPMNMTNDQLQMVRSTIMLVPLVVRSLAVKAKLKAINSEIAKREIAKRRYLLLIDKAKRGEVLSDEERKQVLALEGEYPELIGSELPVTAYTAAQAKERYLFLIDKANRGEVLSDEEKNQVAALEHEYQELIGIGQTDGYWVL